MTIAATPGHEVVYPSTDHLGDHELQRAIGQLLEALLKRLFRQHQPSRVAHVSGDQFFYWEPGNNKARRAPDVYVIEGVAQDIPEVGSWRVWEGHRPHFALEVVSEGNASKDYGTTLGDYEAMGVEELVIYDPGVTPRSRVRRAWQMYRRVGAKLEAVVTPPRDRVYAATLNAWIIATAVDGRRRLRVGVGAEGRELVATPEEEAEAWALAASAEREAKEAALAEVAALRAELAALRKSSR